MTPAAVELDVKIFVKISMFYFTIPTYLIILETKQPLRAIVLKNEFLCIMKVFFIEQVLLLFLKDYKENIVIINSKSWQRQMLVSLSGVSIRTSYPSSTYRVPYLNMCHSMTIVGHLPSIS